MIPEFNLMPIKMGDTYTLPLSFWEDECETTPKDVSEYTFKLMAKNYTGTTMFIWYNIDFEVIEPNERKVTLTPLITAAYVPGEFNYELQVTTDVGTYTWMQGFVQVLDQVTS